MSLNLSRVRLAWLVFVFTLLFSAISVGADVNYIVCKELRPREAGIPICLGPVDSSPLGGRIPVILIHGLKQDGDPFTSSVWNNLIEYLGLVPWFRETCKLYRVDYVPNQVSIKEMGRLFAQLIDAVDDYDHSFSSKEILIIGHSMGGLVARSFMEEARLNNGQGQLGGERVTHLVTLGTPHHGTPIANGPARDVKAGPLVGLLVNFFDYGFFNEHISWSSDNRFDLHWDNYDGMLDYERFSQEDNLWLRHLNETGIFQWKISAYAGVTQPAENLSQCLGLDFGCTAAVMRASLGIEDSDGVVPSQSASFDGCYGCQPVQFPGYNHSQMATDIGDDWIMLYTYLTFDLHNILFPDPVYP